MSFLRRLHYGLGLCYSFCLVTTWAFDQAVGQPVLNTKLNLLIGYCIAPVTRHSNWP